ncbi:MAG TPA: response regulator transcription factor [Flavobacteriales bacterium]|jgi:DNA-binding NarL/FixJ family response regulator|nr:response regulator transcription factor [Flavobacteriales bacterium]MBK7482280.1 response regulator transcription factor [Flavobacteriales bacterium]MBK7620818.1 response regulator transcription factor [Flavobacteriales bacterium]MBK8708691.1 response regulator transcription factor [Flavobacteriales bacterium]MBK9629012.1 response regulator transcription factor [Flavobacteriales bacterium]
MSERGSIAVAIVEDDGILREAFEETLQADAGIEVVGSFACAEDYLMHAFRTPPAVVIMDLNLPGITGIECIRRIKEWPNATQVLVCTVQDDDESLFNALCAGATGYLLKDARPAQVLEAVKFLHAGGSPMGPGIARRVIASFATPQKQPKEFELLTEREREVLEQLAKGQRYKEIAEGLHLSIDTVRTHVRNLYEKLQVSSRTDALNKLYPR